MILSFDMVYSHDICDLSCFFNIIFSYLDIKNFARFIHNKETFRNFVHG